MDPTVTTHEFSSDGSTATQIRNGLPSGAECTIAETDDLGASDVSITCEVIQDPQSQTTCTDDTTAFFADTNAGVVEFTVTNTLEPEAEPAAAEAVAATPTFTG